MRPFVDVGIASKNKFNKLKATGALPFDQVPVLFKMESGASTDVETVCKTLEASNADDVVAESMAICRHVARLYGLDGATEAEKTRADVIARVGTG